MNEAESQPYRRRLLAFKKRLSGARSELEEEALRGTGGEASGGLSDVPLHLADLGTDAYEEEMALGMLENEDQLLTEVNDALERLAQGGFGRCEECGQEIDRARLSALPYARYCLRDAQELQDSGSSEK